MEFFIDSCNKHEIIELLEIGLITGITTNPSILSKYEGDVNQLIQELSKLNLRSISIEVHAIEWQEMLEEAEKILKISDLLTIKLPITMDGLRACKELAKNNIHVNMTLCFSLSQALAAARVGAKYVSPFIGRLEDNGYNGMKLIQDICTSFAYYPEISTQTIAASIRNIEHIEKAALYGADIVTASSSILKQMLHHHLTDEGLKKFEDDWRVRRQ